MSFCKHCNGTGEAPDRLRLECIGCQKPVWVTFRNNDELTEKCLNVRCAECLSIKDARNDR